MATTGYAVLEEGPGGVRLLEAGAIRTASALGDGERLRQLREGLQCVLERWRPDAAAVEQLFFGRNVSTAVRVAEARGVVLLALAEAGCHVTEHSPSEVKRTLTGSGRADKQQVRKMLRLVLGLERTPPLDDVTDAMAVAWCRCFRRTP